ncbi:MAG: putative chemotaxis response regulator [Sporomusa sp.]|jgi:hypothetical protein|nr:putative chemotaxis response regulator [Sporomusa sp.]
MFFFNRLAEELWRKWRNDQTVSTPPSAAGGDTGSDLVANQLSVDNLTRIAIVGTDSGYKELLAVLDNTKVCVVCVVGSNPSIQGNLVDGISVEAPSHLREYSFDYVVVTDGSYPEIERQLVAHEVAASRIIDFTNMRNLLSKLKLNHLSYRLAQLLSKQEPPRVLITGLSFALFGIDQERLTLSGVNFAGSGQDLYYDYRIVQHLFKSFPEKCADVEYVVIGLGIFSFGWDVAIANKNISLHTKYNAWFGGKSREEVDKTCHELAAKMQLLESISTNNYANEFLKFAELLSISKENLLYIKSPFVNKVYDYMDILRNGESGMVIDPYFFARYRKQLDDYDITFCVQERINQILRFNSFEHTVAKNIAILADYISFLHDNSIKPILLLLPVSEHLASRLPKDYLGLFYQCVSNIQQQYPGLAFYDYFNCDQFSNKDFFDLDHLNINGAKKMTDILNTLLAEISARDRA